MIQHSPINKFLLICIFGFFINNVFAQNIETLYVNMPDYLNPTLSKQNRLELMEYYKVGQGDSVKNRFGNKVQILCLDTLNNLLVVKNTASSTFEMKLHIKNDSTWIIGLIRTVCAPVCSSAMEFYDTAWHKLKLPLVLPKAIEWFDGKSEMPDNLDVRWVNSMLEDSFVSLSFDPILPEIIAQNNSLEFLSEEHKKVIKPLMRDAKFRILLPDMK